LIQNYNPCRQKKQHNKTHSPNFSTDTNYIAVLQFTARNYVQGQKNVTHVAQAQVEKEQHAQNVNEGKVGQK
jgi:hypothetical protein